MPSAYLLVSHGSRDPRPQIAMEQLAKLIYQHQARIIENNLYSAASSNWLAPKPEATRTPLAYLAKPLVEIACLELSPLQLHQQIVEFSDRALAAGYNRIQIVPLFLLAGVHVTQDIPQEVEQARQIVGKKLSVELRSHLGTHPNLIDLLASQIATTTADAKILLAHGSRRPSAKLTVEKIATQLGASVAYWAVEPKLATRVQELVDTGHQQIAIVPYFLFAGGITDAIASNVAELKRQFSSAQLQLLAPIGASAQLANLIMDLFEE